MTAVLALYLSSIHIFLGGHVCDNGESAKYVGASGAVWESVWRLFVELSTGHSVYLKPGAALIISLYLLLTVALRLLRWHVLTPTRIHPKIYSPLIVSCALTGGSTLNSLLAFLRPATLSTIYHCTSNVDDLSWARPIDTEAFPPRDDRDRWAGKYNPLLIHAFYLFTRYLHLRSKTSMDGCHVCI